MTEAEKAAAVIEALDNRRQCHRCGELAESYHTQRIDNRCERDEFYRCACGERWWQTFDTTTEAVISKGATF